MGGGAQYSHAVAVTLGTPPGIPTPVHRHCWYSQASLLLTTLLVNYILSSLHVSAAVRAALAFDVFSSSPSSTIASLIVPQQDLHLQSTPPLQGG